MLGLPRFDGYQESTLGVSKQQLINFDRNRYNADGMVVGKTVSVRAYSARIVEIGEGDNG